MRLIDAAKAALELLEYGNEIDAITALRAAIEAAEKQEPVAWMGEYNINDIRDHYTVVMRHKTDFSSMPDRVRPLYTHPQPECDHIPVTTFGGDFCIKCNEPMDSEP